MAVRKLVMLMLLLMLLHLHCCLVFAWQMLFFRLPTLFGKLKYPEANPFLCNSNHKHLERLLALHGHTEKEQNQLKMH